MSRPNVRELGINLKQADAQNALFFISWINNGVYKTSVRCTAFYNITQPLIIGKQG